MGLVSFHGDQKVKDFYLSRIRQHAEADEIVKGQYWEKGRGCGVGCTIHGSNHASYETELGIPEWLARLEDALFEGQTNEDAKQFAVDFLAAIPIGVNLDPLKWRFCAFLMTENINRVLELDISDSLKEQVVTATRQVLSLHEKACEPGQWEESAAWSAESAAWSAAWSAESAAWSAAWSAAYKRYADELLGLLRSAA